MDDPTLSDCRLNVTGDSYEGTREKSNSTANHANHAKGVGRKNAQRTQNQEREFSRGWRMMLLLVAYLFKVLFLYF
jgi:hypothetical protein